MMTRAITPASFHPKVELRSDGALAVERATLSAPEDAFASGLELAAIAADTIGHPLFARAPLAWQARLVARVGRHLTKHPRDLRGTSAAATVLLDVFEGARARTTAARALRRDALAAYLTLLERVSNVPLRDSMTFNLDRCRELLDVEGRATLAAAWHRILPPAPPYAAWFPAGSGTLRVLCQVQDVFFESWRYFFRTLGFRPDGTGTARRIRYVREDHVGATTTRIVVDYVNKGRDMFTAMRDPTIDVVMFLGHSDWWARVPRDLADAPDQVGAKLLVVIMCFGKHFFHALHTRYPDAHIVTTKDPTEDPEDVAMLRHVFAGIGARKSWRAIHRAASADAKVEHNFIFPDDARYVAGVMDEDRDGRLDRFDRFCNVGARRTLAPTGTETSFIADPIGLHPRGAELDPRELDGGPILEAALMLNSLSYDNWWLDQVNRDQRVVAGGWHHAAPGDLAATRFVADHRDGRPIVRLTVSTRYARATQPALTAIVVYEGWCWWARRVSRKHRPSPRDTAIMGMLLVAHALGNADYHQPEDVFHAFLRRWGFPAHVSFRQAYSLVEYDEDWESGSPKSVDHFAKTLAPAMLERLVGLLDQS